MIRIVALLICMTGLLAKDVASLSWEIWFVVNQRQIAAEKCENKAIPMMHCNGKCYLAKQLKKLEQKEQDHNSKVNPYILKMDWIAQSGNLIPATFQPDLHVSDHFRHIEFFRTRVQDAVFHPPSLG